VSVVIDAATGHYLMTSEPIIIGRRSLPDHAYASQGIADNPALSKRAGGCVHWKTSTACERNWRQQSIIRADFVALTHRSHADTGLGR
jgi:hypothetical protein